MNPRLGKMVELVIADKSRDELYWEALYSRQAGVTARELLDWDRGDR